MKHLAIAAALLLGACATHPDRIAAIPNEGECTSSDRQRLAELSLEQRRAANTDAAGVFLIGLPLGSMSGPDHEAEIALLKGRCE